MVRGGGDPSPVAYAQARRDPPLDYRWTRVVCLAALAPAVCLVCHPLRATEALPAPGTIVTVAGNGRDGYAGDNGPAAKAVFTAPLGRVVDRESNLYLAD